MRCVLQGEVQVTTEYLGGETLKDIVSGTAENFHWWTDTRKVITITGIVIGMKYIHEK
jgi:hypothetical protein